MTSHYEAALRFLTDSRNTRDPSKVVLVARAALRGVRPKEALRGANLRRYVTGMKKKGT